MAGPRPHPKCDPGALEFKRGRCMCRTIVPRCPKSSRKGHYLRAQILASPWRCEKPIHGWLFVGRHGSVPFARAISAKSKPRVADGLHSAF